MLADGLETINCGGKTIRLWIVRNSVPIMVEASEQNIQDPVVCDCGKFFVLDNRPRQSTNRLGFFRIAIENAVENTVVRLHIPSIGRHKCVYR